MSSGMSSGITGVSLSEYWDGYCAGLGGRNCLSDENCKEGMLYCQTSIFKTIRTRLFLPISKLKTYYFTSQLFFKECKDLEIEHCPTWKAAGHCADVKEHCAKTCGFCSDGTGI